MAITKRRSEQPLREQRRAEDRTPATELREEMDRIRNEMTHLFERFVGRMPFETEEEHHELTSWGPFSPRVNVREDDDAVRVTAEIPGMDPEDVDISVDGNRLTIRGEKRIEHTQEEEGVVRTERQYGSFRRDLSLPARVDEARCEARYDNGVLHLTLPKVETGRRGGKRIPISR